MKNTFRRSSYLQWLVIGLFGLMMLSISACGDDDNVTPAATSDPVNPWAVTATAATWLDTNPYADKHDGGWVYSAREDCLYSIYGNDNQGKTLYRINHIGDTSTVATTFLFGRHGAQPVIDDTGTNIYMPPSAYTAELERYNTVTDVLETLAPAPFYGTFAHGTWKDSKLWIVLDDDNLYSYDPATNSWSAALYDFGEMANVAGSGPSSNLIYIIDYYGSFYSYDVTTAAITTLTPNPNGFELGGNAQFTWFGSTVGFIYAAAYDLDPAIYDIATGTWHQLSDPKGPGSTYAGHATYDSSRMRLYVVGSDDDAWYYQF